MRYSYIIIKENYPELQRESTIFKSPYKRKKYAFIEKTCFNDGSEAITRIIYSDDLMELHKKAEGYISWYNYPLGLYKDMQQSVLELN